MRDIEISNTLKELGIPAHILGYPYLRHAIKMVMEDMSIAYSICKQLYPEVAKHFDSTSARVERACRHAIELAYNNRENIFAWINIFCTEAKPTVGCFIASVADYLRIRENRRANDE